MTRAKKEKKKTILFFFFLSFPFLLLTFSFSFFICVQCTLQNSGPFFVIFTFESLVFFFIYLFLYAARVACRQGLGELLNKAGELCLWPRTPTVLYILCSLAFTCELCLFLLFFSFSDAKHSFHFLSSFAYTHSSVRIDRFPPHHITRNHIALEESCLLRQLLILEARQ